MAASQRRLEKVLGHLQAHTDSLSFQETAGSELSDNDVVIVRYVSMCFAVFFHYRMACWKPITM